jgi:hypothetical protein
VAARPPPARTALAPVGVTGARPSGGRPRYRGHDSDGAERTARVRVGIGPHRPRRPGGAGPPGHCSHGHGGPTPAHSLGTHCRLRFTPGRWAPIPEATNPAARRPEAGRPTDRAARSRPDAAPGTARPGPVRRRAAAQPPQGCHTVAYLKSCLLFSSYSALEIILDVRSPRRCCRVGLAALY